MALYVVGVRVEADRLSAIVKAGICSKVGVVGMVLVAGFSGRGLALVVSLDGHQQQEV